MGLKKKCTIMNNPNRPMGQGGDYLALCNEIIERGSKMKIILLSLLLYLFMTNVVNAQCAWILWESTNVVDDSSLRWHVSDAFPSHEKCKQAQQTKCKKSKKVLTEQRAKNVTVGDDCPDLLTVVYPNSSYILFGFLCLPDTIDPRK